MRRLTHISPEWWVGFHATRAWRPPLLKRLQGAWLLSCDRERLFQGGVPRVARWMEFVPMATLETGRACRWVSAEIFMCMEDYSLRRACMGSRRGALHGD